MATTYNFPPTSRYYNLDVATYSTPNGPVAYLRRRFLPAPELFALLQLYTVTQGDRLDLIAAKFMNDPLLFWQIADANNAMRPEVLTETVGRSLRITLPQGIPGLMNA